MVEHPTTTLRRFDSGAAIYASVFRRCAPNLIRLKAGVPAKRPSEVTRAQRPTSAANVVLVLGVAACPRSARTPPCSCWARVARREFGRAARRSVSLRTPQLDFERRPAPRWRSGHSHPPKPPPDASILFFLPSNASCVKPARPVAASPCPRRRRPPQPDPPAPRSSSASVPPSAASSRIPGASNRA